MQRALNNARKYLLPLLRPTLSSAGKSTCEKTVFSNSFVRIKPITGPTAFLTLGSTIVWNNKSNVAPGDLNFEDEIMQATIAGAGEYLSNLILILESVIVDVSLAYQRNLRAQVETIEINSRVGVANAAWDNIVQQRVEGKELRQELDKYEALFNTVDAFTRSNSNTYSADILQQLEDDLQQVRDTLRLHIAQVRRQEIELLFVHRDSINAETESESTPITEK